MAKKEAAEFTLASEGSISRQSNGRAYVSIGIPESVLEQMLDHLGMERLKERVKIEFQDPFRLKLVKVPA